jgi:hypothetical protein
MSRYTYRTKDSKIFAWGKDHACGWFYQIFDLNADDPEEPIVDKDQLWDGITHEDIRQAASENGVGDLMLHDLYGI